jgi:DNA-binding response OmpR family regulator
MPSKPQTRVLYVDYHDDSREMLKTLLSISQIDVTAVASAESALSLIDAERFDIYLLDSWLADTDGFELCRLMRESNPDTPVLFFSGAAYDTDKRRGMEAGASAYLCKPDLDGLLGSINQFVSHPEGAAL